VGISGVFQTRKTPKYVPYFPRYLHKRPIFFPIGPANWPRIPELIEPSVTCRKAKSLPLPQRNLRTGALRGCPHTVSDLAQTRCSPISPLCGGGGPESTNTERVGGSSKSPRRGQSPLRDQVWSRMQNHLLSVIPVLALGLQRIRT